MMNKRKLTYISGALVLVPVIAASIFYFMADREAGLGGLEAMSVEAQEVRRGAIVRRITAVGTLVADQRVVIHPEISGKIKRVVFEGGEPVKQGDPLVEIDDEHYKAQLKEAEGILNFAKLQYDRATKLVAKSAGSVREKDKTYSELLQAEAKYDLAKLRMNNTVVRAPFDGVVGLKEYSVGAFVDERTELLDIVDVDPIKVDFRVPASFIKSISKGQQMKVVVDGFREKVFEAAIESIDAKVDPHAHSILVRAAIPNKSGLLKPGLFARLKLVVGSKEGVLIVPESSVLTTGDESYLYRIVDIKFHGKKILVAVKTRVITGISEGGNLEITRGVREGEQVVTVGLNKVRHEQPVRIVEAVVEDNAEDDEDDEE